MNDRARWLWITLLGVLWAAVLVWLIYATRDVSHCSNTYPC